MSRAAPSTVSGRQGHRADITTILTGGGGLPGVSSAQAMVRRAAGVVLVAAAVGIPAVTGNQFSIGLADLVVVFGLLAVTTRFFMVEAALLPFSQMGFFGLGAYATLVSFTKTGSVWPGFAVATFGALLAAWLLGLVSLRLQGFFFAIFTLAISAFAQITVGQLALTGGTSGISLSKIISVPVLGANFSLGSYVGVYEASVVACLVLALVLRWLDRGATGLVVRAARENEPFARALGISPVRQRTLAFVVCSVEASVAGVLFALFNQFMSPDSLALQQVLIVLAMAIVGGRTYFWAPIIGAVLFEVVPSVVNVSQAAVWLAAGAVMAVVVLLAPGGIAGLGAAVGRGIVATLRRTRPGTHLTQGRPAAGSHAPTLADRPSASKLATPTGPADAELAAVVRPRPVRPGIAASPRGRTLLDVQDVVVRFGGLAALDGVSLDIAGGGEVVGLVGANGSGKTTLVNVLGGTVRQTHGVVRFDDVDIGRYRPERRSGVGLVRTFQDGAAFPALSAEACRALPGIARRRRGLTLSGGRQEQRAGGQPTNTLPGGELQMLMLELALACSPKLVLLDEPTTALGAEEAAAVVATLQRARADGVSMLVIEHHFDVVTAICDRVYVLDSGRIIAHGPPAEVSRDPDVIAGFLGSQDQLRNVQVGHHANGSTPVPLAGAPLSGGRVEDA